MLRFLFYQAVSSLISERDFQSAFCFLDYNVSSVFKDFTALFRPIMCVCPTQSSFWDLDGDLFVSSGLNVFVILNSVKIHL